jgi:hypothetical protein
MYHSPFKLLPTFDKNSPTLDYTNLKRRLLAEFELNENKPIPYGNTFLGKTEALEILEQLKDPEKLIQHKSIAENVALTSFLENGELTFFTLASNYKYKIPAIVSEDFVTLYANTLAKCYQTNKSNEAELLLSFPIDKTETLANGYERLIRRIQQDLIILEDIEENTKDKQTFEQKIHSFFDQFNLNKIKIINRLPEEYKYLSYNICACFINITSKMHNNKYDKKLTKKAAEYASILDGGAENNKIAKQNMDAVKTSYWGLIKLIFFVILILARMATCAYH